MTLQRQIVFWVVSLIVFVFLLWLLKGILLPFIAGMVLAYFLDPLADVLERLGLPRAVAALLILGLSILIFVLALFLLVPVLIDQVGKFAQNLPAIAVALA